MHFTIQSPSQPWPKLDKVCCINWPIVSQKPIDNQKSSTPLTSNCQTCRDHTEALNLMDNRPWNDEKWPEFWVLLIYFYAYALSQHSHQGPRVPAETIKAQQQSEWSRIPNFFPPHPYSHLLAPSPPSLQCISSPCLSLGSCRWLSWWQDAK